MLLADPRYKDPVTGKPRIFPYKTLLSVVRVQTEADGKEWLKAKWSWEGLRRDKQIEVGSFETGVYDHPTPVTGTQKPNPRQGQDNRDSPERTIVTGVNYQQVYDIPFTRENYEKELAKRSAPRDE
jgi:hypothetical protein